MWITLILVYYNKISHTRQEKSDIEIHMCAVFLCPISFRWYLLTRIGIIKALKRFKPNDLEMTLGWPWKFIFWTTVFTLNLTNVIESPCQYERFEPKMKFVTRLLSVWRPIKVSGQQGSRSVIFPIEIYGKIMNVNFR